MKRRSFLVTLAAGAVGVSGCTSNAPMPSPTDTLTEADRTYSNCVSDIDMIQHQNFKGKIPIRWNDKVGDINSLREDRTSWTSWIVSNSNYRNALQYENDLDRINEVEDFIENTELSSKTIFIHYWKIPDYQRLEVEFIKWGKASGLNDEYYDIALNREFVDITDEHNRGSLENIIITVIRIPAKIERANSVRGGNVDRPANC